MKSIFTIEQIEYLKNNYDKMSYKEIADKLGFTERQIRGKINGLKLTKRRKFNTRYFRKIESPNQAYWLGFIYADGYLVYRPKNRNSELGIDLKDTDYQCLYDFNNELGNAHTVTFRHRHKDFNGYSYDTNSCIIRIYSHEMVCDLMNLNVMPNKTNKEEYTVCDNYFWDFVRGFLDGDGCIYVNPRGQISVKFVNSNVGFLEYLRKTIDDKLHITGSIYKEKDKKYQLVYFVQSDVKLFLDNVYYDSNIQFMQRKYDIYKSYYGSPT